MNTLGKTILSLVLLEVVLTGLLVYGDITGGATGFCVSGEFANCETVQNSIYGEIFGMKMSVFGLVSFLALLVVFVYEKRIKEGTFLVLAFIGAIFAGYFIYLQLVVLKQICSTCMVIDGTAILIFFLTFFAKKKRRWSIG